MFSLLISKFGSCEEVNMIYVISFQVIYEARSWLSSDHQLVFRFFKLMIFLVVITSIAVLYTVCKLSVMDMVICCFAFLPTGWGLLSVRLSILLVCFLFFNADITASMYFLPLPNCTCTSMNRTAQIVPFSIAYLAPLFIQGTRLTPNSPKYYRQMQIFFLKMK